MALTADRKWDVFISYARTDLKSAQALERLLIDKGLRVWRDENRLRPGENVDIVIPAALQDASTVVTLWSARSVTSDWVRHETSYAVVEGKCVTLSIGSIDHGALPSMFRSLHCGDLAETLRNPTLLLERLWELADPARRAQLRRIDITRLPTTYAPRLFGRDSEMADLLAAWDSRGEEKTNIVALDAMGGTGKTALVHHFIDMLRRQGWRGAEAVFAWSFYSQGTDDRRQGSAEPFFEHALSWFGYRGPDLRTQHDKGVALAQLVSARRCLLVLDGLEPLQYAAGRSGGGRDTRGVAGALKEGGLAAMFKQLATENAGLLIVTTRLRITDLQGFPRPGVVSYPVERIATQPGIELLRSLGVIGRTSELKATVEDFRGHALALTSLGRYLATTFEGDIRRRDTVPSVVDVGGPQERDPFRVMMAYEILFRRRISEQVRGGQVGSETAAAKQLALLFLIGLFDRPAERAALDVLLRPPAIAGLTDDLTGLSRQQWNQAIAALRALGLLAPPSKADNDDLDAHPLVREFFGARLSAQNPTAWRQAHELLWRYYTTTTAEQARPGVEGMMTFVHAINHAALADRPTDAIALYEQKIRPKINAHGLYAFDLSVLLNFFTEPWQSLLPGIPEEKKTMLLARAQSSLRSSGRLAEAAEATERGCAMLRAQGKWPLYVDQRVELLKIFIALGRLDRAIEEASAALAVADRENVPAQKADILCYLGHARHMTGDRVGARKAFHESNAAAEMMRADRRLSSFRQFAMNELYLDEGSRTVVRTWTARTVASAKEAIATRGVLAVALDYLSLGRLGLLDADAHDDPATKAHDLETAAGYIEEALFYLRGNNHLDELPRALVLRAEVRRRTADFTKSRADLAEAMHIAEHFEMPLRQVDAYLEAAVLELSSGESGFGARALEYADAAERLIEKTGYARRRPELTGIRKRIATLPSPRQRIDTPIRPAAGVAPPADDSGRDASTTFARRILSLFRRP